MLISLEWLRHYVDIDVEPARLAHALTMAGFPVVAAEERADGDVQLDVEITSNRPDLQCHVGIAREVATMLGGEIRLPDVALPELSSDRIDVAVEAPDLCPLYTARVIRGVTVGPSPEWLSRALERAGQRSINNVVDVTNFVMLEGGHPLHAFDLSKLRGAKLTARRAGGEALKAIDESLLTLAADDCAIADAKGPVALGGVMGGLDSEVTGATVDIALECALFDPIAIREASRRHSIRSESSFRFERFVDPARARWSSDRAAALLVECAGAMAVGPICEAGPDAAVHSAVVTLRASQLERVLGVPVEEPEIVRVLTTLGMTRGDDPAPGTTSWTAPSWRPDLCEEIDLVEEVARITGFDRIPDAVRIPVRPQVIDESARAARRLRESLVAAGLRECCTEPFVGEGHVDIALVRDEPGLVVLNPMRADESQLRRSVLGPLLRVVRGNQDRGVGQVRFFETAPVYLRAAKGDAPDERLLTGIVVTGGYADVKGPVDAAFERGAPAPLRSDRSATLRMGDDVIGYVGELSEKAQRAFALERGVALAELRTGQLLARAVLERPYRRISRFPAVERDLAVVFDDAVLWAEIEHAVRGAAGELLASVRPFDTYRGDSIGAGKRSLALRMELRSTERTLTGDEADACVDAVLAALAQLGGVIRS